MYLRMMGLCPDGHLLTNRMSETYVAGTTL